jgi:phosphoribosylformylglycinamidine (FGAM) synthase-like enzyme
MTSEVGAAVALPAGVPLAEFCFGESAGRAILAFASKQVPAALQVLARYQLPFTLLGHSEATGITLRRGVEAINWSVTSLKAAANQSIGEVL